MSSASLSNPTDDVRDESSTDHSVMSGAISRLPLAMVLSDPRIEDNPLVYVNKAFEDVTLYSAGFAVGRNCRFLQCDETNPDDLAEIRRGVEAGTDVSVDLLNAKADGTVFMNRLLISPIRNEDDELIAFLGVQREIARPGEHGTRPADGDAIPKEAGQDMMLAEVQHRVKNHLAMIVSMIRMQASREVTKESFDALSHRVERWRSSTTSCLEAASPAYTTRESLPVPTFRASPRRFQLLMAVVRSASTSSARKLICPSIRQRVSVFC